jgi:limonene-1,2-epoxide hydrolase
MVDTSLSAQEALCHPARVSLRSLALLAVVAFGLAGTFCSGGESASGNAVEIVKTFYADVNANEIDDAMRYVAPDAVFVNPIGTYTGRAAIRGFLRRDASEGIVYHHTNFRVDGGRVVYDFRVKQYGSIVGAGTDGLTVVKAGKIVFDGTEATEPLTQSGNADSRSNL